MKSYRVFCSLLNGLNVESLVVDVCPDKVLLDLGLDLLREYSLGAHLGLVVTEFNAHFNLEVDQARCRGN